MKKNAFSNLQDRYKLCIFNITLFAYDFLFEQHRVYNFVKREPKQLCVKKIIPLGSNSAIAFISSSVSSLGCLVEDEAD